MTTVELGSGNSNEGGVVLELLGDLVVELLMELGGDQAVVLLRGTEYATEYEASRGASSTATEELGVKLAGELVGELLRS